jgi:response regulator RpfG family c-di-GMP phosphodiesterase
MDEKVLLVDDDVEILNSFQRHFHKLFQLETAQNGEEGLALLKDHPFTVVVADYMMPKMNGIRFLSAVKEIAPDTTRIMLTGNANIHTAMDAVNEGQIFRFLSKPCTPDMLAQAIQAGIEYNRLLTAEHVLLEQTLNGSITMLVEILSLINPAAFSRAARIKKWVATIVKKINVYPNWYYDLAATLSQVGFVTLPPTLLEKIYSQKNLTEQERDLYSNHPYIARKLLEKIPRMEIIAQMVADQDKPYVNYPALSGAQLLREPAILGAQILKVAIDYDNLVSAGHSTTDIARTMAARSTMYNPQILSLIIETVSLVDSSLERRKLNLADLKPGMVIDEDIFTSDNKLLLQRGMEVTETVFTRLQNINWHTKIKEPFYVLVPRKK